MSELFFVPTFQLRMSTSFEVSPNDALISHLTLQSAFNQIAFRNECRKALPSQ